ncbi:hypothetical protein PIGHUM_04127 [Pigmentiphaga humi]|uniref:Uncharacterized protein n=1 Tax=Pigmentiphaga humi TaxID=2478468 RepID=A0A3P4B7K5_9BURK|nr:hypothetical protein PIGHUM_04127 [Pigmentiphaga humi]
MNGVAVAGDFVIAPVPLPALSLAQASDVPLIRLSEFSRPPLRSRSTQKRAISRSCVWSASPMREALSIPGASRPNCRAPPSCRLAVLCWSTCSTSTGSSPTVRSPTTRLRRSTTCPTSWKRGVAPAKFEQDARPQIGIRVLHRAGVVQPELLRVVADLDGDFMRGECLRQRFPQAGTSSSLVTCFTKATLSASDTAAPNPATR